MDLTEENIENTQESKEKKTKELLQRSKRNNGRQQSKRRHSPSQEKSVHWATAEIKQYNPECPATPMPYSMQPFTMSTLLQQAPPFFQPAPPPAHTTAPVLMQRFGSWHNPMSSPWNPAPNTSVNSILPAASNPFTTSMNPFLQNTNLSNTHTPQIRATNTLLDPIAEPTTTKEGTQIQAHNTKKKEKTSQAPASETRGTVNSGIEAHYGAMSGKLWIPYRSKAHTSNQLQQNPKG